MFIRLAVDLRDGHRHFLPSSPNIVPRHNENLDPAELPRETRPAEADQRKRRLMESRSELRAIPAAFRPFHTPTSQLVFLFVFRKVPGSYISQKWAMNLARPFFQTQALITKTT